MDIGEALNLYLQEKRATCKERTAKTTEFRLTGFFKGALAHPLAGLGDILLDLVNAYAANHGGGTVHSVCREARTMTRWLQEEEHLAVDPWPKAVKKRLKKIAKPSPEDQEQLSIDESRLLTDVCYEEALLDANGPAAPVLVALVMGLRATETVMLRARDIDDGGRLLRVAKAKTKKGHRSLEVPEMLLPVLKAAVHGLDREDRLWDLTRYALYYHVQRLCKKAGVTEVGPHGLRRSHATLATASGMSGHAVAMALGHTNTAVTYRHYVSAEKRQSTVAAQAARKLQKAAAK